MTFLKVSSILLLIVLCGCSKPTAQHHIEYVEVKVPVVYHINRPSRPQYTPKDTAPSYLTKLLQYTKTLEIIIDEHNKGS